MKPQTSNLKTDFGVEQKDADNPKAGKKCCFVLCPPHPSFCVTLLMVLDILEGPNRGGAQHKEKREPKKSQNFTRGKIALVQVRKDLEGCEKFMEETTNIFHEGWSMGQTLQHRT